MSRKVLVTGASGFVGRNVCKRLMEEGYDTYGMSRTKPDVKGLKYIQGDIRNASDFPKDDKYDVVHIAALASDDPTGDYEGVNVIGTKNALAAYTDSKFVHISSSSIYNLAKPSEYILENDFSYGSYKFFNHYSRTKAQAEEEVKTSEEYRNVPAISLRPHGVYGKDDTTLLPRLLRRIRNGKLALPEGGEVYHSLTHIDNLTEAVSLGLEYDAKYYESFNVTDRTPVKVSDAIISAAGYSPKIINIPLVLALAAAKLSSQISEYEIRQIGMARTYNINKTMKALGYSPSAFIKF